MRNFLLIILAVVSISSYKIDSVSPKSFDSLAGAVTVNVKNTVNPFVISDIKGTVYRNGKAFVVGTADDVAVASGASAVKVTGVASLASGVSLWSALGAIFGGLDPFTVDVDMVITDSTTGNSRHVVKKGYKVSALLKK